MPLKGTIPDVKSSRLKFLLYGGPKVGKTTASLKMPKSYLIDTEKGAVQKQYIDLLKKNKGLRFEAHTFEEVIQEIRVLATEKHDFLTVIIDSYTPVYDAEVDTGEIKVGKEWGRHYGYANKTAKRLFNLLTKIDMNVIVTAHEKNEYGAQMEVIDKVPDGWRKLDYLFDLILHLRKEKDGRRIATVKGTRLYEFKDGEQFEWSYENLAARFGKDRLETETRRSDLVTEKTATEFLDLYKSLTTAEIKKLKLDTIGKPDEVYELTEDRVRKGIEYIQSYKTSTVEQIIADIYQFEKMAKSYGTTDKFFEIVPKEYDTISDLETAKQLLELCRKQTNALTGAK
ncbi:MAG: AAA family ATPase [bacterium]